jgi:hypothetical protein
VQDASNLGEIRASFLIFLIPPRTKPGLRLSRWLSGNLGKKGSSPSFCLDGQGSRWRGGARGARSDAEAGRSGPRGRAWPGACWGRDGPAQPAGAAPSALPGTGRARPFPGRSPQGAAGGEAEVSGRRAGGDAAAAAGSAGSARRGARGGGGRPESPCVARESRGPAAGPTGRHGVPARPQPGALSSLWLPPPSSTKRPCGAAVTFFVAREAGAESSPLAGLEPGLVGLFESLAVDSVSFHSFCPLLYVHPVLLLGVSASTRLYLGWSSYYCSPRVSHLY